MQFENIVYILSNTTKGHTNVNYVVLLFLTEAEHWKNMYDISMESDFMLYRKLIQYFRLSLFADITFERGPTTTGPYHARATLFRLNYT